jgi:hypothetical protein
MHSSDKEAHVSHGSLFGRIGRLLSLSLGVLALTLTLSASALAGGGDPPTGPQVSLSPASFTVDRQGQVFAELVLTCGPVEIAAGAEVPIHVGVAQQRGHGLAAGEGSTSVTCLDAVRIVTIAVSSATGRSFRAGPVTGFIEIPAVCSPNGCGQAFADFEEIAWPVRANRA